jgi:FixJ family two-component response regulator
MYSRTESIPVIFITAYPSVEIKKKVLEMGAMDFITKPFTSEELLPKVKRALKEDSVPTS